MKKKEVNVLHLARKGCSDEGFDFLPLLLLNDNHVCYIRDFTTYVKSFFHTRRKSEDITSVCKKCLTLFTKKNDCANHSASCTTQTTVIYPEETDVIEFSKFHATFPMSHACFLDLEAANSPVPRDQYNFRVSKHVAILST